MIVNITGFIFFAGLLSYFQIRQILAKEGKKAAIVYGCLMGLASFIGLLLIAGVDIPSQNMIITRIFAPIGKTLLGK